MDYQLSFDDLELEIDNEVIVFDENDFVSVPEPLSDFEWIILLANIDKEN